jgi:hypothetical protein
MNGDPVGRLFGAFLMAIGGLMALLCGGCSLSIAAAMIGSAIAHPRLASELGVLPVFLLIGGLPAALGVYIFRVGVKARRVAGEPPKPPTPPW